MPTYPPSILRFHQTKIKLLVSSPPPQSELSLPEAAKINMIPKTIYFCNKTYAKMDKMVHKWQKLNPEYAVELYDDKRCAEFLLTNFGKLFVDIFNFLVDGPIKADFWRLTILYINGGVYSDIDNEPLVPIASFLADDVDFVTCSSYINYQFNPNFIVAPKGSPILKKCIDWYVRNYLAKKTYAYWKWSIMQAMTDTCQLKLYNKLEGIYDCDDALKVQIIQECRGKNHYDDHNLWKGIRIFNNRVTNWNHINHSFF